MSVSRIQYQPSTQAIRSKLKLAAEYKGQTLSEYIETAITEKLERDALEAFKQQAVDFGYYDPKQHLEPGTDSPKTSKEVAEEPLKKNSMRTIPTHTPSNDAVVPEVEQVPRVRALQESHGRQLNSKYCTYRAEKPLAQCA